MTDIQLNSLVTWIEGSMLPSFHTTVCIQRDKAVLQAYLMIQHTPPADAAMMSASKHHKHVQPCSFSPFFPLPFFPLSH